MYFVTFVNDSIHINTFFSNFIVDFYCLEAVFFSKEFNIDANWWWDACMCLSNI